MTKHSLTLFGGIVILGTCFIGAAQADSANRLEGLGKALEK